AQVSFAVLKGAAVGSTNTLAKLRVFGFLLGKGADACLQSAGKLEEQQYQSRSSAKDYGIGRVLRGSNFFQKCRCNFGCFRKRNDAICTRLANRCVNLENRHAQSALVGIIVTVETKSSDDVSRKGVIARGRSWKLPPN